MTSVLVYIIDIVVFGVLFALRLPVLIPVENSTAAIIGIIVGAVIILYMWAKRAGILLRLGCSVMWALLVYILAFPANESFSTNMNMKLIICGCVLVVAFFFHNAKAIMESVQLAADDDDDDDDYEDDRYERKAEKRRMSHRRDESLRSRRNVDYDYPDEDLFYEDEEYEDDAYEDDAYEDDVYEDDFYEDDYYEDEYEEYPEEDGINDNYADEEYFDDEDEEFYDEDEEFFDEDEEFFDEDEDYSDEEEFSDEDKEELQGGVTGNDLVSRMFIGCNDKESLISRYRNLMRTYHPDNNGGNEEMAQAISAKYTELIGRMEIK